MRGLVLLAAPLLAGCLDIGVLQRPFCATLPKGAVFCDDFDDAARLNAGAWEERSPGDGAIALFRPADGGAPKLPYRGASSLVLSAPGGGTAQLVEHTATSALGGDVASVRAFVYAFDAKAPATYATEVLAFEDDAGATLLELTLENGGLRLRDPSGTNVAARTSLGVGKWSCVELRVAHGRASVFVGGNEQASFFRDPSFSPRGTRVGLLRSDATPDAFSLLFDEVVIAGKDLIDDKGDGGAGPVGCTS